MSAAAVCSLLLHPRRLDTDPPAPAYGTERGIAAASAACCWRIAVPGGLFRVLFRSRANTQASHPILRRAVVYGMTIRLNS
uniref:Uncharacterized protein n=1 Tax=Setaria viridis TaxID=4556 RepID=A0A4U6TNK7_SETVI|nr:hypothetical protein SEVIR_7G091150v2 [Setaria viridis]